MKIELPIDAIQPAFVDALQNGNVVVEAATGSGKSTRLPLWCRVQGRVLVVQPRRLAAKSLARYLARQSESEVGQLIGYAVRFDTQYNTKTQVVFVTPGIALRMYAENALSNFSCVVLDEFHERRWDTDLLAAMARQQMLSQQTSSQPQAQLRLGVTSATVEGESLARYFQARRLTAEGRRYPVNISYQDDNELPRSKQLEHRVVAAIQDQLSVHAQGDLLVFLPGKTEIAAVQSALKTDCPVIPLHAAASKQQQDQALSSSDRQRIILSTNVAETSLTIPGVSVVIDSGLERRTHHRNARTVLGLHAISQAAADQRAGRAGRLGPGHCLRLWGRKAVLQAYTPAEIEREELTELVLAAAAANVAVEDLVFPSQPPQHALSRAIALLQNMRALDERGRITEHGRRLYPLPLDALFAHLISAMPTPATCAAMIDLSAALSAERSPLGLNDTAARRQALQHWQAEACDLSTLIALMRETPPPDVAVNANMLKQARRIARHVYAALNLEPVNTVAFPRLELLRAIYQTAPDLLYVRRQKRRDYLGNGYAELEVGRESRFSEESEAAVVLDQHYSVGKGLSNTINKGTCMAPVSLSVLDEWQVGDLQFGRLQWDGRHLLASVQRVYAGRVIRESEQSLSGDALRRACVQLIKDNRLYSGLAVRLRDDINAWNLYLALGMDKESLHDFSDRAVVEFDAWLLARLQALGVEQEDDLAMLENHDFQFTGIPAWERESFDQKFPLQVCLSDLVMQVEYDIKRRQVILHKLRGIRKTPPKRLELPSWSGWSIQFRDASKAVDIARR